MDKENQLFLGPCLVVFQSKGDAEAVKTILSQGEPDETVKTRRKYYNPEDVV